MVEPNPERLPPTEATSATALRHLRRRLAGPAVASVGASYVNLSLIGHSLLPYRIWINCGKVGKLCDAPLVGLEGLPVALECG